MASPGAKVTWNTGVLGDSLQLALQPSAVPAAAWVFPGILPSILMLSASGWGRPGHTPPTHCDPACPGALRLFPFLPSFPVSHLKFLCASVKIKP